MKPTLILSAAGAIALAALTFAACKVTAEAEAGPGVPLFGGSTVRVDVDGRSVTPVPAGDPAVFPQPGDCVKLHFKDANGREIGTAEVPAGTDVDAPDGTEGVTWSPCDPTPKKDPKGKTKKRDELAWDNQARVAGDLLEVPFRALPVRMEDGRGRWIDYTVKASSLAQAEDLAAAFEATTWTKPRPAGVETFGFADVEALADGRVRFSAVTWKRPSSFLLEWNGTPLAGAQVTRTAGGWYASSVLVPASLVNFDAAGLEVHNQARYVVETAEGQIEQTLAVTVFP